MKPEYTITGAILGAIILTAVVAGYVLWGQLMEARHRACLNATAFAQAMDYCEEVPGCESTLDQEVVRRQAWETAAQYDCGLKEGDPEYWK